MFQEGKVYIDKYERLFFYEHGYLHTSTGFRYNHLNSEDLTLTKLTKLQMFEMLEEKKKARYRHGINL